MTTDYPSDMAGMAAEGMPAPTMPTGVDMGEPPAGPDREQDRAKVAEYLDRIKRAEDYWEDDFKAMRQSMELVAGYHWLGQTKRDDERYIVYLTLRQIAQKVSTLYAKDPTVNVTRRPRRDFAIWDESVESIMEAGQQAMAIQAAGMELPPELAALFQDIEHGRARRDETEAFGETLENLIDFTWSTQTPEFKVSMKQAVQRTCTASVSYVRPVWCNDADNRPTNEGVSANVASRAQETLSRIQRDPVDDDDAIYTDLRALSASLGYAETLGQMPERVEYEFPPATSIIVDPRCRNLVGFVGARWLAQKYVLPLDEVNAIFGTSVTCEDVEESYDNEDTTDVSSDDTTGGKREHKRLCCVYEVWDSVLKSRSFIAKGYKDFLLAPEPPNPPVTGFWQHFPIVFNSVETEPGCRHTCMPPSDVQTIRSAQLEWNRRREALRDHRNANAPKYLVRKGQLTKNDREALTNAEPNTVIEIEGGDPSIPLDRIVMPLQFTNIDAALYDVAPLEQDVFIGSGMQQANLGPAQSNTTATVGSIAEQSRMNVTASNVDDLDYALSAIARATGEMIVQKMSNEVASLIVGPGTVFPRSSEERIQFLNEVFIQIEAASSGRPNKALDIANWRDLVPLLLQAGANPAGIVQETVRRMDDRLEVAKFFPLVPTGGPATGPGGEPQGSAEEGSPAGEAGESQPAVVEDSGPGAAATA